MKRNSFPIGPFIDYPKNPILRPSNGFQSKRLYNPSVIKEGKKFYMFYRAESDDSLTGRIGLAESEDGINFVCHKEPLLSPSNDFDRGGCEDPRIVKFGDTYYLTYVGNSLRYGVSNICLAISKDLLHWEKLGPVLTERPWDWDKGQLKAGVIVPEMIDGKFVMYFMGEEKPWQTAIGIAYSDDLINWYEPIDKPVLEPRKEYFDSHGIEPGPTPVMIDEGILLIYNGWCEDCVYQPGGVIFSRDDPERVIMRTDEPLLSLMRDYGSEFGTGNHCVAEGLVKDNNRWLLYYGAADHLTCLAIYEEGKE